MNTPLYALWLPITNFDEFYPNIKEEKNISLSSPMPLSNTNWSWICFEYEGTSVTIDSLGFIYLDRVEHQDGLRRVLDLLVRVLNKKSKDNIESTFLNKSIGYVYREDEKNSDQRILNFLNKIIITFPNIDNALKLEFISSRLTLHNEMLLEESKMKFSIEHKQELNKYSDQQENKEKGSDSFHAILNRNFENLLKKGIYFTHGLNFEKGELYSLSITENIYEGIKEFLPKLELKINGDAQNYQEEELFRAVVKKIVQDTIEERIILNFLKVTKFHYLNRVIDEIAQNSEILKKLNSYLLEDISVEKQEKIQKVRDLDDESATEIFIQNLLQVIPKFYMMDTKIQEAYYIKIGNTTTNLTVKRDETILNTLYYSKWKASIYFFIETATKAKESLGMYHQNKTLRELEDISYNANYQADIEDIRELQKQKAFVLDESSKKILSLIAIVTLAGEAPLLIIPIDEAEILYNMGIHAFQIFVNFSIYFLGVHFFVSPLVGHQERLDIFTFFRKKRSEVRYHSFEETDYDKHEHRANRSLYSYNNRLKEYQKIHISYNNLVSAYTLVSKLKKEKLSYHINLEGMDTFRFHLFPKLLRDVPIKDISSKHKKEHIYRENYRISGNDRVATKIMYRYKINELTLCSLLEYIKEDEFIQGYEQYLKTQSSDSFILSRAIKNLEPHPKFKEESKLTLYIVYSFVLKFDSIDEQNKNLYDYTISKDQFRVHYHINKLDYRDKEDFELKQANLAKLIDVYFLKRIKRFKEVELKL